MTTKQRYDGVIAWFSEHMPVAESELHYTDPYQLLVAVILSAQCTDKRVNMTTPALFEAFPTPFDMAAATAEDIYPYIKSISYPNNKARNLAGMARMLCSEFAGQPAGRGPQDGQRAGRGVVAEGGDAGRYARLPRLEPHRPDNQLQNAPSDRADTRKEHSAAPAAGGPSLAHSPRPLCLHGPRPEVRRVRHRRVVPQIRRRP